MRKTFFALIALTLLVTPAQASTDGRVGIAAVVNEDIITYSDIGDRVRLYMGANPGKPTPEQLKQLQEQVLHKLIDEKLEMQEAKTLGINVSDEQIKQAFATIAAKNNKSPEDFKASMLAAGVPVETLHDQLRAEISWGQVVRRKLRPQVNISEGEIDNEAALVVQGKSKLIPPGTATSAAAAPAPAAAPGEKTVHIAMKQIVIPITQGDPEPIIAAKMTRAASLKDEVKSCADMDLKMQDFPSEATGDIEKQPLDNLPPPLKAVVATLPESELSAPIRGASGIAVIMVCEREEIEAPVAAAEATPAPATAPLKDEALREEIATRLGLSRLTKMAEQYLRDLRAAAFIDKRI